jgi:cytoskeletal protein CcmA (bactofilin family)
MSVFVDYCITNCAVNKLIMEEDCVMNKKRNIMDIINKTIFVEEEVEEEVVVEKKDKKSAEKKIESKKVDSRPEKVVENKNYKAPKVEPVYSKPQKVEPEYAASVISYGTKITGDIVCKADLQVEGIIEGNINCDKAVTIKGKVKGNIKADALTTIDATIVGNVNCNGIVNILGKTNLQGDVNSSDVVLEGEIKGNIIAENRVSLKGTSILDGNTTSAKIMVEEGSTIIGSIQTVSNKKSKN